MHYCAKIKLHYRSVELDFFFIHGSKSIPYHYLVLGYAHLATELRGNVVGFFLLNMFQWYSTVLAITRPVVQFPFVANQIHPVPNGYLELSWESKSFETSWPP